MTKLRVGNFIGLTLLVGSVSFAAGATEAPPEPPDLSSIDIGSVLSAYAEVAGELEAAIEEAIPVVEELADRAADATENPENEPFICISPLGSAFMGFFGASFAAPDGFDLPIDIAGYGADVALKFCRPYLTVTDPEQPAYDPEDDGGADECTLEVDQVSAQTNTTFLTVPRGGGLGDPRLTDWGPLGSPTTFHVNSDVDVRLLNDTDPDDDQVILPYGEHTLTWEAVTTISPLDLMFLYIPGLPESSKRWVFGIKPSDLFDALIGIIIDLGLFQLSAGESRVEFIQRITTGQPNSATTRATTEVTVWDLVDPVITSSSGNSIIEFEGLEPGGASIKSQRQRLRPMISFSDKCRQQRELQLVEPANFWPAGEVSDAVWTVFDPGPNRDGERNSASVTQRVRVVDTLPPVVLAPPSQVREIPNGQARQYVPIGAPRTFDFVDLAPTLTATFVPTAGVVQVDGGYEFPPGVTEIQWCAEDFLGNDSCENGVDTRATQVINVKPEGTNTAPTAISIVGNDAISAGGFEPVEITVSGSDPDFDARSGRFDPLGFAISKAPENGFFIAPLLPYFIEDYRIPFQDNVDRCTPNRPPEVIVEPQNLRVAESGLMYVLGAPLVPDPGCDVTDPFVLVPSNRISVFQTNGDTEQYLRGRDLPRANDLFGFYYDEPRNRIMYTYFEAGPQILVLDGDTLETIRQFNFSTPMSGIRKAVLDGNGILYTSTGFARVNVWDTRLANCTDNGDFEACDLADTMITELRYFPPELEGGGNGVPIDLALTSDDSLIIGTFFHIYQYNAATISGTGDAVPGDLVGFIGACSDGPGCDLITQSTRGFSCTHDTCTALYPPSPSDGPGQFSSAASIALDPNDALYVADRNNRRVQRFTSEGFYAGEAKSSCDDNDFDRCLQKGFVLANFGRPDTISVNSKHLYVLDPNPALELVHVFQTSVLTSISDNEASITYQSDTGFDGLDSFEFVVSDGLDVSEPAVVEIDVTVSNRNAPLARDQQLVLDEDVPLEFLLDGADPDFGTENLAYEIVTPPANGSLTGGAGAVRTYTPRANYFGTDSFTYRVNDGGFESGLGTVSLTINPVGDTPVLFLPPKFEADMDEPGYFAFAFADADPDSEHTVEIDWGDGTFEREGVVNDDGTTTGPILSENNQVTGFVFAFHTYSGPPREVDVTVCILPPTTTSLREGPKANETACRTTKMEIGFNVFEDGFE
jgi:hypothetical protein